MIEIGFYHLAERRVEAVLPQLVGKALSAGHRILVRSSDTDLLNSLDDILWQQPADSFVPHGIDNELASDRLSSQPVLLSAAGLPAANAADCLAQIGDDLPEDLAGLTRVLFLFDAKGAEVARNRWCRLAKVEGVKPVYWRETDGGRFEKAG